MVWEKIKQWIVGFFATLLVIFGAVYAPVVINDVIGGPEDLFTEGVIVDGLTNEPVDVFVNESHFRFSNSYLNASLQHIDVFVPTELQDDLGYVTPCDPNLMVCQGDEPDPIYGQTNLFHVLNDPTNEFADRFYIETDYLFTYATALYDPDQDIPDGFGFTRINQEVRVNYSDENSGLDQLLNTRVDVGGGKEIQIDVSAYYGNLVLDYTYYVNGNVVGTFQDVYHTSTDKVPVREGDARPILTTEGRHTELYLEYDNTYGSTKDVTVVAIYPETESILFQNLGINTTEVSMDYANVQQILTDGGVNNSLILSDLTGYTVSYYNTTMRENTIEDFSVFVSANGTQTSYLYVLGSAGAMEASYDSTTQADFTQSSYFRDDVVVDIDEQNLDGFSFTKWNEETVNLTFETQTPTLIREDGELRGVAYDMIIYDNSTTVFTTKVKDENLEWYYQPPLYLENGLEEPNATCNATHCDGSYRPEHVVGSYAVYHNSEKNNKYETGKAFHVYRPWVEDSNGNRVWGSVRYFGDTLYVSIPQEFLNNATYPVRIDPTFGYDTAGGSSADADGNYAFAFETTLDTDIDYISSITVYLDYSSTSLFDTQVGTYSHPTNLSGSRLQYNRSDVSFTSGGSWVEFGIPETQNYSSGDYHLLLSTDASRATPAPLLFYDSGSAQDGYDFVGSGVLPSSYGGTDWGTGLISIYATYPESNSPPIWSDNSTSGTGAGTEITFSVKWTDDVDLSDGTALFYLHNGSNTTSQQSGTDQEAGTQSFSGIEGSGGTSTLYSDTFSDGTGVSGTGNCAAYWNIGSSTPSSNTGPQSGDSDDAGSTFVYIETSSGNCDGSPSDGELLVNNEFDWDAQDGENVTFKTNRYGDADLGTMIVQENSSGSWTQLGTYSQTGSDGNNGLSWTQFGIDASSLTGIGHIRFRTSGHSSFTGDAAIDDLNVTYEEVSTEQNKSAVEYQDTISGTYSGITSFTITTYVNSYSDAGSTSYSNVKPELFLLIWNGTTYEEVGNFSLSGTGNASIEITDSTILSAWETESDRDLKLQARNLDYFNGNNIDTISWTGVWVENLTTTEEFSLVDSLNFTDSASNSSEICFQEQANESTVCGGLSTGTYDDGTFPDSNWRDGDTSTSSSSGMSTLYSYANYTIPTGATTDSKLEVCDTPAEGCFNVTISGAACEFTSTLQIRYTMTAFGSSVYPSCWNGTSWENINGTDIGVDGGMNEERIYWNISDIYLVNSTVGWSNFTATINSTSGATIKWYVTANDSAGNSNTTDTFQFTTTSSSSCIYGGSGTWNIDCTEGCTVDSDQNPGANDVVASGSGTVRVEATQSHTGDLYVQNQCTLVLDCAGECF